MSVEIQVGEHFYVIEKLTAMQQFHVGRRLLPLVGSFFAKAKSAGIETNKDKLEILAELVLGPMAQTISDMPDDTADFIVFTCLSVAKRKEGNVLAPVKTPGQNSLMYQDMDFREMIQIVVEVIKHDLSSFFFEAKNL